MTFGGGEILSFVCMLQLVPKTSKLEDERNRAGVTEGVASQSLHHYTDAMQMKLHDKLEKPHFGQ